MRVAITGAGEVGYHLAKLLAGEAKDITIIDEDEDVLSYIGTHLDVQTVHGNAKSITILNEANVKNADLLITVTSSEETNLLVAIIGKKLGAKSTIARVDSRDMLSENRRKMFLELGVDTIVSPSVLASEEITRLIRNSAFTDEYEFEDGKLVAFGISVCQDSKLIDKAIGETHDFNPDRKFKPIALHRKNDTLLVNSSTVIRRDDIVYFISHPDLLPKITKICGKEQLIIRNVMIMGGSDIGILTAMALEEDYNVMIVEKNKQKCEEIARYLKRGLVINLDGSDVEALVEEGLDDMDAFIAVTSDSEINIMACLMAKNHSISRTIARVENFNYIQMSQNIGIDSLINKKIVAATEMFKFVRKGEVEAIASLHAAGAEIIEYSVKEGSKVTKHPIRDLGFPQGVNVAGVIRDDRGFVPFGDFQLQAGDHALIFALKDSVQKIEDYFS